MNGAEKILRVLSQRGINTVFTNPGTSEMQLVAAFDDVSDIQPVLGLFEGVCTGAADGYARIAGKPAATLLHLGPGLANGLANLHNARRAGSMMLNIVGDHALDHQHFDAPLATDIVALAQPMSDVVASLTRLDSLEQDTASAADNALANGGQISTLVVPADLAWSELPDSAITKTPRAQERPVDRALFERVIQLLTHHAEKTLLLLSGNALSDAGMMSAYQLQQKTGCRVATPTFCRKLPRGLGRPVFEAVPYLSEMAIPFFAGVEHVVLLDAPEPVAFFAYPGKPGTLLHGDCEVVALADKDQNPVAVLSDLTKQLHAEDILLAARTRDIPDCPSGAVAGDAVAQSLARHMPDQAIIVDEAITSGAYLLPMTENASQHDWLFLTGGSIGQGIPVATGAAIAAPSRKVINFEGDGSALYTIQGLWTQARENLDVVTVVFNNAAYAVLQFEMMRTGSVQIGEKAMNTLKIDEPRIDFAAMAESYGVQSATATTADEFDRLFETAVQQSGPFLIDVIL